MTTVATDGHSMAGDGLSTGNGLVHGFHERKVRRLDDGRVLGMCGNAYNADAFEKWLVAGANQSSPPDLADSFEAMVLHVDGSVICYDEKGRSMAQDTPAVIGSGGALALGAMLHGATPGEAVNIACKRDTHSGGRIKIEYLTPKLEEAA